MVGPGKVSSASVLNSLGPWLGGFLLSHSSGPWALIEEWIKVNRPKTNDFIVAYVHVCITMFHVEDEVLELFVLACLPQSACFTLVILGRPRGTQ